VLDVLAQLVGNRGVAGLKLVPRASAVLMLAFAASACIDDMPPASMAAESRTPALTYAPENVYLADNCLRHEATRTVHTVEEALEACEDLITLVPSFVETPQACRDFHEYRYIESGSSEQQAQALAARENC
jgi:hypothetical protein